MEILWAGRSKAYFTVGIETRQEPMWVSFADEPCSDHDTNVNSRYRRARSRITARIYTLVECSSYQSTQSDQKHPSTVVC